MDAKAVLKEVGIEGFKSVQQAIQQARENIVDSHDPTGYANAVITALGGEPRYNQAEARIVALSLLEQAIKQENYDVEAANKVASEKLSVIMRRDPYIFKGETMETQAQPTQTKITVMTERKMPRAGSKLEVATNLVRMTGKDDRPACLKAIMETMNVTRGNASIYYTKAVEILKAE